MSKKVIYVDIDETICITPDNPRIYEQSTSIIKNKLKDILNQ